MNTDDEDRAPLPATTLSPSPKPATSSRSNRLTPSEIESLRKEHAAAIDWATEELRRQKQQ